VGISWVDAEFIRIVRNIKNVIKIFPDIRESGRVV
jgi:hypothetical protein